MFDGIEGFDEFFFLEVFKECDNGFASVCFLLPTGVFDSTFEEQVVEGKNRRKLSVSLYFNDSAQDVVLELDVHFGVLLPRHVEEFGVEGHELIFEAGDLPERRFVHQLNDDRLSAIDCGSNAFRGQKRSKNFKRMTCVTVEFFAIVSHVDLGFEKHEFFGAVDDGSELIFAGVGVSVVDFAGESAIDDTGRNVAIADVIFGNTDAEDIEIELLDGFGESERCVFVNVDSEWRNDFAKLPVLLKFDKFTRFAGIHLAEVVVGKSGEFFGETIIGKVDDLRRIDLNVALFYDGRRNEGIINWLGFFDMECALGVHVFGFVGCRRGLVAAAHPIRVIDAFELHDSFDFVEVATVMSAKISCEQAFVVPIQNISPSYADNFCNVRCAVISFTFESSRDRKLGGNGILRFDGFFAIIRIVHRTKLLSGVLNT